MPQNLKSKYQQKPHRLHTRDILSFVFIHLAHNQR